MRSYFFTFGQMGRLDTGIQHAHSAYEMIGKYHGTPYIDILLDYVQFHKTIVFLDAGNYQGLMYVIEYLRTLPPEYLHTTFNEDEVSLAGLYTSACVILPDKIYDTADILRRYPDIIVGQPHPMTGKITIGEEGRMHSLTLRELAIARWLVPFRLFPR